MNETLSNERIKRFWGWCGFEVRHEIWVEDHYEPDGRLYFPDGKVFVGTFFNGWPVVDLNNLFQWAVPKVLPKTLMMETIVESSETKGDKVFYEWAVLSEKPSGGVWAANHVDPATALFLAIEKLIDDIPAPQGGQRKGGEHED